MDMNLWLEKAQKAILELKISDKFEVRSLFQGCEWELLPKGDRIAFGKFFKSEVLEGRVDGVQFLERANDNHAKYQKIEEGGTI